MTSIGHSMQMQPWDLCRIHIISIKLIFLIFDGHFGNFKLFKKMFTFLSSHICNFFYSGPTRGTFCLFGYLVPRLLLSWFCYSDCSSLQNIYRVFNRCSRNYLLYYWNRLSVNAYVFSRINRNINRFSCQKCSQR